MANNAPSPESLQAVLEIIEPGSTFVATHSLAGDFSNSTHLVDVRQADVQPGWLDFRIANGGTLLCQFCRYGNSENPPGDSEKLDDERNSSHPIMLYRRN